jgi:hypothetical protein
LEGSVPRFFIPVLLTITMVPVVEAQERDAMEPRPPLILTASRTDRLEAAVRLYLQEFIGAIQRADTVALGVLVPAEAIPNAEKPVALRAGCASLGTATARLRAGRAGESGNPALPLAGVRLRTLTIDLAVSADTVARIRARILEHRGRRILYVPVEVVFVEAGDGWRMALAHGALVGMCGLALESP